MTSLLPSLDVTYGNRQGRYNCSANFQVSEYGTISRIRLMKRTLHICMVSLPLVSACLARPVSDKSMANMELGKGIAKLALDGGI